MPVRTQTLKLWNGWMDLVLKWHEAVRKKPTQAALHFNSPFTLSVCVWGPALYSNSLAAWEPSTTPSIGHKSSYTELQRKAIRENKHCCLATVRPQDEVNKTLIGLRNCWTCTDLVHSEPLLNNRINKGIKIETLNWNQVLTCLIADNSISSWCTMRKQCVNQLLCVFRQ